MADDITVTQPQHNQPNEHINRRNSHGISYDEPINRRNNRRNSNEDATSNSESTANPQQAPNNSKWTTIPGRNVKVSRQGSSFIVVIDLNSESDIATQRGTKYVAKIDDRTELTLDGKKYVVGLWMKAVETRAAARNISL